MLQTNKRFAPELSLHFENAIIRFFLIEQKVSSFYFLIANSLQQILTWVQVKHFFPTLRAIINQPEMGENRKNGVMKMSRSIFGISRIPNQPNQIAFSNQSKFGLWQSFQVSEVMDFPFCTEQINYISTISECATPNN